MKQTEKLDLILRKLYNYKFDGTYYSLKNICEENNLPIEPYNEVRQLAKRLEDDGYINILYTSDDCMAEINSYGVEYCEEDSYSHQGDALITNSYSISITNSPNSNLVNHSSNINITINNFQEIKSKINEIKKELEICDITSEIRKDALDCLDEVETSVDANKVPRFSLKNLIDITANISGISSLVLELSKLII